MAKRLTPSPSSSRRATPRKKPAPKKPAPPPLRNVVPDSVDFRDRKYMPAVAIAPRAVLPPPPATHRPQLDQEQTSACTGFALATAVHILTGRRDGKRDTPVSPYMLYGMARRYDDLRGEAPEGGSTLRGVLKGWYKHGVCMQALWPALDEPAPTGNTDWWDDGVQRPLGAYYRVDARSVVDMQVALNETGVLIASALAHDGWLEGLQGQRKRLRAGQKFWRIPYPWKAKPDDGHAFAIIGYDADGFLVQNSWGTTWGTGGLAVLSYEDWIEHGYDCWVAQLGVVTRAHELQATGASGKPGGAFGAPGTLILDLHAVSPYVVNTGRDGALSPSGEFHTILSDLDELVDVRLAGFRKDLGLAAGEPVDVALYAHGGLVSERAAGQSAKDWIDALRPARVFPIFLFWESDIFTVLGDRVANELKLRGDIPTGGPLALVDDFWSDRVEGIARVAARWAWDEMKRKATLASSSADGGVRLLLDRLTPLRSGIRLHLIGHSAGAILLAALLDELDADGWTVETLSLMAPAATVARYEQAIAPRVRGAMVRRALQIHLSDECENNEGGAMRAALLYKRSLLYLIANAFEGPRGVPVLGMQKYFERDVLPQLPPGYQFRIAPGSAASGAVRHGDFDNDARTQASVVAHVLGQPVPLP